MDTPSIKEEARRLIEALPDDSTWEDLMHRIYVRQAIEAGLKDSKGGRVVQELELPQVREVLEGPYRIFYRIRPDRIEVLENRSESPSLDEPRSSKAVSDPDFAHFWDGSPWFTTLLPSF